MTMRRMTLPLAGLLLALGLSATAPAQAASRELALKLLAIQQPNIDAVARSLVENPVRQMLNSADAVIRTRVAADKREATAKQIQDAARKYMDETLPVVRKQAQSVAQQQMLPQLEQKFSDDEIKQLLAFYESPVAKKLQTVLPDLNKALAERLVADVRGDLQNRLKTLDGEMTRALGLPAKPASAP